MYLSINNLNINRQGKFMFENRIHLRNYESSLYFIDTRLMICEIL